MSKTTSQENKIEVAPALSICDVMRDNTNQVIMKVESLLPTYIESFANLQEEYLRIARDFFGTCYIAEKELLDKLGVDHKAIEGFDKYLKVLTKYAILDIDMTNNFQKTFVTNTISAMKTYDNYVKLMLSEYAKMLEYTSALLPKKN
ncbi:MAG: hypothetical protein WA833_04830 [Nitrosotalea sp.]